MSVRRRRRSTIVPAVLTLETPVLTHSGVLTDLSPDYTIGLDAGSAENDVLTFWTSEANDFLSYIEETYSLTAGDLGGTASFASADLSPDITYYVKVKHTRASPAAESEFSNVVSFTLSAPAGGVGEAIGLLLTLTKGA